MTKTSRVVNVQDAKTHLSRLLRQVEAGEEIRIARNGRVIARLVPSERRRRWGGFEGRVTVHPGAFDPVSDEDVADWEEGPLVP